MLSVLAISGMRSDRYDITGALDLVRPSIVYGDEVMLLSYEATCSCELVEPIAKSQPTVSHHTKVLADAGLIVGEKAGRWVNWSVVPERIEELRAALASS